MEIKNADLKNDLFALGQKFFYVGLFTSYYTTFSYAYFLSH